ncbi:MAG: hypothetical protein ACREEL_07490 [Stellaceae bacterium]
MTGADGADDAAEIARSSALLDGAPIPSKSGATVQQQKIETANGDDHKGLRKPLALRADILAALDQVLRDIGLVGERRAARLLYLAVTSRVLPRIVSIAVKGPSSVGKSELVKKVLALFPEEAAYGLTSMSEKALIYDDEPLQHRMLVIYEWAAVSSEFQSYLVRTLLSEGRLIHPVTVKGADGQFSTVTIEREGPTGLLVTTTGTDLHPENETRMLSVGVSDSTEQTRAILRAQAEDAQGERPPHVDLEPWRALQRDIGAAVPANVRIPFATKLAELVPPAALRLRRDFPTILSLIQAHAVLHRATRECDGAGAIVATVADYAACYGLVADLVSEGVDGTVSGTVRETVDAVRAFREEHKSAPSVTELAKALGLHKSSVSRRVNVARGRGYLKNGVTKAGLEARLVLGEPLPDAVEVLPTPGRLAEVLRCCSDFQVV